MKIALAQLNFIIGDFEYNTRKIKDHISKASLADANLVVFSELSVCGYPPQDFLDYPDFIEKCRLAVQDIAAACQGIAAVVGCPTINEGAVGKKLYNSALVLCNGKIHALVHKTLLPTYDIFDEYRYFEPNRTFELVSLPFGKIALTICEDLWNLSDYPLYVESPLEKLLQQQAQLIINIAASPFHYDQKTERKEILARNASRYKLPLYYVNQVGAHTDLIFDGNSMVLNHRGEVVSAMSLFEEDFRVFETSETLCLNEVPELSKFSKIELIHDALILGIRDYFNKSGLKKAILGLSGGIDSAVVLVLAARALGSENVLSLLLPSAYSSIHSVKDAVALAHNLQSPYELIKIEDTYQAVLSELYPYFSDLSFDTTEENLQARIRAVLLMAFSNKFGHILLNTSNKSEAAVGYGTLYGDICGGLSVIGDMYKTEVYELALFINQQKEIIPNNIIVKAPSAELRPNQKDSDSLPEYDILDQILFQYINLFRSPDEIIQSGFDPQIVKRVLKMVNTTEWKRRQTPPILRVSPKAFGFGRRMPIVAKYLG